MSSPTPAPIRAEIVGNVLAIVWSDDDEDFFEAPFLRKHSPSAEQTGEVDIFGIRTGGNSKPSDYSKIKLLGFDFIGNYAIRIKFSDGHATGIYSWEYLKELSVSQGQEQ